MEDHFTRLGIHVASGPDADDEEVDEAISQLRRELLDLDVVAVEVPRTAEPPPGTRAADAAEVGTLVVSMAKPELLGPLLSLVRAWLSRWRRGEVTMVIGGDVLKLTGVPAGEQRRLADEWLRRHEGG